MISSRNSKFAQHLKIYQSNRPHLAEKGVHKKLDKKYPMTIGMESKRVNKREEPVKNGWDFMARYWWILKLVNT